MTEKQRAFAGDDPHAAQIRASISSRTCDHGRRAKHKLLSILRHRAIPGIAIVLLLGGCGRGVLDPQGPIGVAEKQLLIDATTVMLVIVIPVIVLTVVFAWWFRTSNARAQYLPDWSYSGRIEIVVWLVPLLVIAFLGGIGWIASHDLDPRKPIASARRPIEIQVVSLDWKWLFIYPDAGVATVNQLVLPKGVPVTFRLTSAGVMNSFFVPQLGSQIYTMAGMETHLNLLASNAGSYPGLSAQFSGDGFSDMRFTAIVTDDAAYARWLTQARKEPLVLDQASYGSLVRQRSASGVVRYGRIAPGLFDGIVMQRLPMVPAPRAGHPAPSVSPRSES